MARSKQGEPKIIQASKQDNIPFRSIAIVFSTKDSYFGLNGA
jgi:hypothetical protein